MVKKKLNRINIHLGVNPQRQEGRRLAVPLHGHLPIPPLHEKTYMLLQTAARILKGHHNINQANP